MAKAVALVLVTAAANKLAEPKETNQPTNTTVKKELKLDDSIKWHNIKLNPKYI